MFCKRSQTSGEILQLILEEEEEEEEEGFFAALLCNFGVLICLTIHTSIFLKSITINLQKIIFNSTRDDFDTK